MAVSLYKPTGKEKVEWYQKTASEAFTFNDMVYLTTAGRLTRYTDGASAPVLGLVQKTVVAADSDYASTTRIPVLIPDDNSIFLFDVDTGTAAQTDVGEYIDVDDHNGVDVGASTNNDVYVTQFISTTQVLMN